MIAYHTSKGEVVNFTRALAGDWGRHGITVNALVPGFFPSNMTKGTLEAVGADKLAADAPLRPIGDQDDLKAQRSCSQAMPANTSRDRYLLSTVV
jgi:NAD(P)-dependent dehydrogenase (short-subunit alcohol dehydrogenase family)